MVVREKEIYEIERKTEITEEQKLYSIILYYGSLIGITLLAIGFGMYVSGVHPPYVEYETVVELWDKDTHTFVEEVNMPTGWGWLRLVNYGDVLNLLMLAFLATLTIVCYILIIPVLLKKRDVVYTIIALAEVAILLLAASGVLQVGH